MAYDPWAQQPLLGRAAFSAVEKEEPAPAPPPGHTARFAMFGMMPGFLNQPLGLEDDMETSDATGSQLPSQTATIPSNVQLLAGHDNPYFDLRLPGDPGGVGYYRVFSQMQVVETGKTSVCVNLQAMAPAGQQYGGLNNGATVLSPGVSVFQELGLGGAALQGFIGQNIRAPLRGNDPYSQNLKYGMGVQCPLVEFGGRDCGLYVFMQALGRYYYDGDHSNGLLGNWNLIPGVHWRVNDKCWFSLGASRFSLFTCSWQF